jgi:hypothetical protein
VSANLVPPHSPPNNACGEVAVIVKHLRHIAQIFSLAVQSHGAPSELALHIEAQRAYERSSFSSVVCPAAFREVASGDNRGIPGVAALISSSLSDLSLPFE